MWNGKYKAYASGTTKRFIGTFDTPEEAHVAWKAAKHKLALSYAEKETDERVAEALRLRYA